MADGFSQWRAELLAWQLRTHRAAAEGVSAAMPALESAARSTTIFHDDTGATRGSIVGYVVAGDGSLDQSDRADSAYNFAEERNPGSATDDYIAVGASEVVGILTTFTFYAPDLENRGGGENGFIGPTMDAMGVLLHNGAIDAIRRVT